MHSTIQRLAFASCFVYSPTGTGVVSERSRVLRELLKAGEVRSLFVYAHHVRREVTANGALAGFLGPSGVLVPVPGRAPCLPHEWSVSDRLAAALIGESLGQSVWRGLRRVHRVRKSATAPPGLRPTVEDHCLSFAVQPDMAPPPRMVLVDDVVTKGRTLLAAAMSLHEAFPASEIRAFALMRTVGYCQGIPKLTDPCVGEIRWRGGDAHRNP